MSAESAPPVGIHDWSEAGYQPLVFSAGWQVALLNWEPLFDSTNLGEIERHNETDEVFVLWQGQGVLFIAANDDIEVIEMKPGVIYNVPRGAWHNLVATRDASWIIVENRDTHVHDTELRQMTDNERQRLLAQLPDWCG